MMSISPAARRAVAVATFTCLAGLLAACGGSSPSATPINTVTVSAAATPAASAPAAPATSAAPPPASPAAPAGPAPCPTRDLGLKLGLAQGALGSTYQVIDFTNIGTATCTLYGYPGVSLTGGTPVHQLGLAANEDPSTPRKLVTLAPGAVANALLRIVNAGNYPTSKCAPVNAKFLQIYPPNQTTPAYLSYHTQACSKPVPLLTISVVKPGSGG